LAYYLQLIDFLLSGWISFTVCLDPDI